MAFPQDWLACEVEGGGGWQARRCPGSLPRPAGQQLCRLANGTKVPKDNKQRKEAVKDAKVCDNVL